MLYISSPTEPLNVSIYITHFPDSTTFAYAISSTRNLPSCVPCSNFTHSLRTRSVVFCIFSLSGFLYLEVLFLLSNPQRQLLFCTSW